MMIFFLLPSFDFAVTRTHPQSASVPNVVALSIPASCHSIAPCFSHRLIPNFFTPNTSSSLPVPNPPQSASHRNRIKAQRPSSRPGRKGDVWSRRADAVRDAFLHAYKSYLTHWHAVSTQPRTTNSAPSARLRSISASSLHHHAHRP